MGTKRKRPGSDPEEASHDQTAERTSTTIQRELQARAAIDKGHTLLFRAFKTARGFERQKLGRRRKTAGTPDSKTAGTEKAKRDTNNDNDNDPSGSNAQAQAQPAGADAAVARIEAETAALKALDLTHVTTNYLIKSLLKFKEVAESPSLPGFFRRMAPVPKDAASLNVVARLCNSNPVREVLGGIVKETTAALGVRIHAAGKDKVKGKTKTKTKSKDQESVAVDQIPAGTTGGDGDKEEEDEFQGFEDELAASSDADSEADEATIQRRTSLLRAALTETPEDDEGSQDTGPSSSDDDELSRANLLRSRRNMSTTPSPDRDLDPNEISDLEPDSDSDVDADSASELAVPMPVARRAAKRTAAPAPAPAASLTSTTFLPTLTMGGYISGSSDDEADDYNGADSVSAAALLHNKPKSNRRGQRARRAIWEAKYGEQAKHLGPDGLAKAAQQQNGKGAAGRDAGWDAKRGATDGPPRRFASGAVSGRGGRGRGGAGAGAGRGGRYAPGGGDYGREPGGLEAPKKRVKDDEGPLHPSWIAAKKAKEAKGMVNATFQGKKLTFD